MRENIIPYGRRLCQHHFFKVLWEGGKIFFRLFLEKLPSTGQLLEDLRGIVKGTTRGCAFWRAPPTRKKGEKNLKNYGDYGILSSEYRPFAERPQKAEHREMPACPNWSLPLGAASWRGIYLDSFDQAWELICEHCKTKITDVAYKTWFTRLKPVSLDFDRGWPCWKCPTSSTSAPCSGATATSSKRPSKASLGTTSPSRSASTRS